MSGPVPPFPLSAGDVAAAMSGRLISGSPATPLATVSIDTRTLRAGDLFIAIAGERFDGHAFIDAALERGAAGVVARDGASCTGAVSRGLVAIVVGDTIEALQALARHVRRLSGSRVIAITGSAGKTTTKEVTAEFLALRHRTYRNRGNLNNHIGLPLSLLELQDRPDVAVVELGMNHPGEIGRLVAIAEPDVRVWTNVGDAHLGFFGTREAIADAKAEILEGADAGTTLVANAGDPLVMARVAGFAGRVVTFAAGAPADVSAIDVEDRGLAGMAARLRVDGAVHELETPLMGRGNLENVLAAIATARLFDVPLEAMLARAATLAPAPHRGQVVRLARGLTILDDAYNSSPTALRRALEVIGADTSGRRRVAVLGEMLELGDRSVEQHEACGRAAAAARLDLLVTCGGEPAKALAEAAVSTGMPADRVRYVPTSVEAAAVAAGLVRQGDVVLVKGSRGIRMERVVERLSEEWG